MLVMLYTIDPFIPNLFIFNYDTNPYVIIKTMYAILSTDYDTYSVNLECGEFGRTNLFVYARDPLFQIGSALSSQISTLLSCVDKMYVQIGWIKSIQNNCEQSFNQTSGINQTQVTMNATKLQA